VLRALKLPRPSLLVGDGATDLEARPEVDCFAAFTGVVSRPAVAAAADVVLSAPTLAPVLALAAAPPQRERLRASPVRHLLARAERGLASGHAGSPATDFSTHP
jgi:phosphoserine phosphatase